MQCEILGHGLRGGALMLAQMVWRRAKELITACAKLLKLTVLQVDPQTSLTARSFADFVGLTITPGKAHSMQLCTHRFMVKNGAAGL